MHCGQRLAAIGMTLVRSLQDFVVGSGLACPRWRCSFHDRARLIDVVTQLLPFIGYPRTLNGLRAVNSPESLDRTRAQ